MLRAIAGFTSTRLSLCSLDHRVGALDRGLRNWSTLISSSGRRDISPGHLFLTLIENFLEPVVRGELRNRPVSNSRFGRVSQFG